MSEFDFVVDKFWGVRWCGSMPLHSSLNSTDEVLRLHQFCWVESDSDSDSLEIAVVVKTVLSGTYRGNDGRTEEAR